MRTPSEWATILAPTVAWQACYPIVEGEVRAKCADLLAGETLSTNDLVEQMYPEALARGEGITARRRLYKAIAALAPRGLSDCCSRGEPRKLRHAAKLVRPWLWHMPSERPTEAQPGARKCPHCGGDL